MSIAVSVGTPVVLSKIGFALGTTISPGVGTVIGIAAGLILGGLYDYVIHPAIDNWIE